MSPERTPTRGSGPTLVRADYPTLEVFFSGYLHEDFVAVHGSPSAALRAFRADANKEEQRRFALEAVALLDAAATLSFNVVVDFIRGELGASWRPANLGQLQRLLRDPHHAKRSSRDR
jgi:hypothetical protein